MEDKGHFQGRRGVRISGPGSFVSSPGRSKPGVGGKQTAGSKGNGTGSPTPAAKPALPNGGKKPDKQPAKRVWHVVGGVDKCMEVPTETAGMIIFVLPQRAEYYLQVLPTAKFREALDPRVEHQTDAMAARLRAAVKEGRVMCDRDGWEFWDALVRQHLRAEWRKEAAPRPHAFHADLAAQEAKTLGAVIHPCLMDGRMRVVGPELPEPQRKKRAKKPKRCRVPSDEPRRAWPTEEDEADEEVEVYPSADSEEEE